MANPKPPNGPPAPVRVNIVGASARAAAFSAIRGGLEPYACDLFGDADLRAWARFEAVRSDYPEGLEQALARMADAPFLYTGGLENHPDLVDRLAAVRPLWGSTGESLRRARDPMLLAEVLRAAGAEPPRTRRGDDPPRDPAGWLWKPLAGAGGRSIAPAAHAAACLPSAAHASSAQGGGAMGTRFYFQHRARGTSCSALYAARPDRCQLLGATRQLVGERWLHAPPFAWCGSVGPLSLSGRVEAILSACGEAAARSFGLRGVFGVDFILGGDVVQPVELNPRYTASAEILEHGLGFSAVALHAAACAGRSGEGPGAARSVSRAVSGGAARIAPGGAAHQAPAGVSPTRASGEVLGKAVLFAPRGLAASVEIAAIHPPDPFRFPAAADIPPLGARIRKGRPVLTVFARGSSEAECIGALREAAEAAARHFRPARG